MGDRKDVDRYQWATRERTAHLLEAARMVSMGEIKGVVDISE